MVALSPAESAEFIVNNANHVGIQIAGVKRLADQIAAALICGELSVGSWSHHELTPKELNDRAVEWIFVTDLLNFSFWCETGVSYEVLHNHRTYTGYWSLCAAVNRAIEEGYDILDPNTYQFICETKLKHIFRSSNGVEIPLFAERLRILRDAGRTLMHYFNGSFTNVVSRSENSAVKLLDLLCEYFPSFQDTAVYRDRQVSFLKRAQILVGDLWCCFGGKQWGQFRDIEHITAFADYRVPQVLYHFSTLIYDNELVDILRNGIPLANGSELEVEIRGATIHAIQLLVKQIRKILQSSKHDNITCNAILVDNYLWNYRRKHAEEIDRSIPMHRTRCIFY